MAKKSSLLSMLLGVVLILALVYFLRPQTFDFLKQGFVNPDEEDFEDFEDDPEDFEDPEPEPEGFYSADGASGSSSTKMHPDINCWKPPYKSITETVKGKKLSGPPPRCSDGYVKKD
jgi:hypothetical protein